MRRLEIKLSSNERKELESLRRKFSDYRSERALAVLHCADGMSARKIGKLLQRSEQTVRTWLDAYGNGRATGLLRGFSPGRPSRRKLKFTPRMEEYLAKSPADYGWGENAWTIKVLIAQYEKETGEKISEDSVERALKDAGYSFKRAKPTPPVSAPSKEEKLEKVKQIASEIMELKTKGDVEVLFLDESHFSTDPYVTRGWHKKGLPFFPPEPENQRRLHHIWRVRSGRQVFLLEKFEQRKR